MSSPSSAADLSFWSSPRGPSGVRLLVTVGVDHGHAADALLEGTGVSEEDLARGDATFSAGAELAVARNLLRHLGDRPGLGVEVGRRYTLGSIGIWGFAMLTCATGREVVRLASRHTAGGSAFADPLPQPSGSGVQIVFREASIPCDVREFFLEREIAKVGCLIPAVFGSTSGIEVRTRFTGARGSALRDGLPGLRVFTGEDWHGLVIERARLDAPLPQADPIAAAELERQCLELIERRRARVGWAGRVRACLLAELAAPPSMDEIAARLHVDPRTLRRYLAAEGTSFRALADEVRSTIAMELLRDAGLTVEESASRLGYHDAASFTRAFKRWTGRTPGTVAA